jgi:hypothetical protein
MTIVLSGILSGPRGASMSVIRFATARALFEAFPEVSDIVNLAPTEQAPTDFVKALVAASKIPEAVGFCAYLLPRREAVWWACTSVRTLAEDLARDRPNGLLAAESWVYQPDDQRRQYALQIGDRGDRKDPTTWLALAAGWSGGSQAVGSQPVPIAPYMTARASRVAILLSAAKVGGAERMSCLRKCIADALKLADHGLG